MEPNNDYLNARGRHEFLSGKDINVLTNDELLEFIKLDEDQINDIPQPLREKSFDSVMYNIFNEHLNNLKAEKKIRGLQGGKRTRHRKQRKSTRRRNHKKSSTRRRRRR